MKKKRNHVRLPTRCAGHGRREKLLHVPGSLRARSHVGPVVGPRLRDGLFLGHKVLGHLDEIFARHPVVVGIRVRPQVVLHGRVLGQVNSEVATKDNQEVGVE